MENDNIIFQCEKDLEDYICNHLEDFIKVLRQTLNLDEKIEFVGRQVKIGNENIADLLFSIDCNNEKIDIIDLDYIIVELKYRYLTPKDLSQISRYGSILKSKLANSEFCGLEPKIFFVFVSFGLNDDMKNIDTTKNLSDFYFLKLQTNYLFVEEDYSYKDEYIEKVELDERILDLYGRN